MNLGLQKGAAVEISKLSTQIMEASDLSTVHVSDRNNEVMSRARPVRRRAIRQNSKPCMISERVEDKRPNSIGQRPNGVSSSSLDEHTHSSSQKAGFTATDMQPKTRENLSTGKRILAGQRRSAERKLAERLQVRGDRISPRNEIQALKSKQKVPDESSYQIRVLPNRDFRMQQEHLETMFKTPPTGIDSNSGLVQAPNNLHATQDNSQSVPSKDYRATAIDLQRFFNGSPNNRTNERLAMSNHGRLFGKNNTGSISDSPASQSEKNTDGRRRSKRHTMHDTGDPLATGPSRKVLRELRSRTLSEDVTGQLEPSDSSTMSVGENRRLLEDLSAEYEPSESSVISESSMISEVKSEASVISSHEIERSMLPASAGLAPTLVSSRGTQDDPIVLDLDEGVDADTEMVDHNPDPQDPARLMRDCVVCGGSISIADLPCLIDCTHRAEICAVCFARWIESELSSKGWRGITCPDANCTVLLAHHEVRQYATSDVFTQYDSFAMRDALGHMPNFRWCQNPGCNSGQENDEEGYIFTCVACSHKTCTIHNVDWHENETCDEYTYRMSGAKERDQRKQEEASIAAINGMSKKCPGPDCAFNIQKNEGCDHMTCSRCRHEFCWECLADYNEVRRRGNTAHAPNCKYHSDRLR